MERKSFLEWVSNRLGNTLNEMPRTARYGGREDDDKTPFSMYDRMSDNEIAEGDWVEELRELTLKWASSPPGQTKELLKQKVDDYVSELIAMGNSVERVMSILNRAITDGRKGTFMRTATRA